MNLRGRGHFIGIVGNDRHDWRPQIREKNDDGNFQILTYINSNPRTYVCHLIRGLHFSSRKVHSIKKKIKLYSYRPNLIQYLGSGYSKKRLTFILRLIAQVQEEPRFLKYIRRTNESKFTDKDVFNKWNNRYCSDNQLFWISAIRFQHVWRTNIWCGLWGANYFVLSFMIAHRLM